MRLKVEVDRCHTNRKPTSINLYHFAAMDMQEKKAPKNSNADESLAEL